MHNEDRVSAGLDELALGVHFKILGELVLHKPTNAAYELVCGHAKVFCKSVCVLFSLASSPRFFLDERLSHGGCSCV